MSFEFILRLVGAVVLASVGWWLGDGLASRAGGPENVRGIVVLALAGAGLGLLLTPYFTTRPAAWTIRKIRQIPAHHLVTGLIGLLLGLLVAALLAFPLSFLPWPFGWLLPFLATIICAYVGVATLVMRERDLALAVKARFSRNGSEGTSRSILLDTSVIIDGRIADVSQTGFLEGTMLVPRFILSELQHIADSSDPLRRNRGRRGLDILNRLQKDPVVPIAITDLDAPEAKETDTKLVAVARQINAAILTNDFNLNKVAELQGIKVLNINELANAVKTVLLPGESLQIRIIQEGREADQGVGYLDDGTMVVIEDGRRHIGREITVDVTRVLQTVAGRMIFAQVDEKERQR